MILKTVFLLTLSLNIQAATFTFENPCPNQDDFIVKDVAVENKSLGDVTDTLLSMTNFDYIGSNLGLNSLWKSPIGMEALDIVSREEMYSYGWCYSINGQVPEKLPHQIGLTKNDRVVWWFAYAHYLRGEWLSQCEHSDNRPKIEFCQ